MRYLPSVLFCWLFVVDVNAICPHEEPLLKLSELYNSPAKHTDIVITEATLLDVTDLDIHFIEVVGEGRLVFNQGHDIHINTKGIFVRDNGQLIIGSEECRHTDNVFIQLEGDRTVDRTLMGPEGEKYIAVTDNGSLHIHGEDRISWTKLSETVDRFDANPDDVVYKNLVSEIVMSKHGFYLNILDSYLEPIFRDDYPVPFGNVKKVDKFLLRLATKLTETTEGQVVTLTVNNKLNKVEGADFDTFYAIVEELTGMQQGELLLRQAEDYDAFALVYVVGGEYSQSLDRQIGKTCTEARSAVIYKTKKITAISKITTDRRMLSPFYDLIIVNLDVGFPEVKVTHDISSWRPGDKVLLTSTDFASDHGEVRTIKSITGPFSFTLTHELNYRHFGEIEDGVDMRGEVALLSRNVKIAGLMKRGCPAENGNCDNKVSSLDTYGGHIKIFDSFGSVVIEGAELEFMGQTMDRGHYPIHFHMCKNITGKTAVIRRNSIHNTFRRAVTIHGTFGTSEENPGVQLVENVAYKVFGHAYFLEDGAESAAILRGNLGAETENIDNDFSTDKRKATTFWITNPKTLVIGNVAAGGQGFGFWYTFPIEPVGPAAGLAYMPEEAKHTALWTFDNNVAHSNELGGLNFDFILLDDNGNIGACMQYETREDPFNISSPGVKVQLSRLTVYKNRDINVWLRGGWFELYKLSSADSKKGLQLARGSEQQMSVTKSIFIGKSRGNAEDSSYPGGVTPADLGQILGTVFHDGPTYFSSSWFTGFDTDGSYIAGAIGFAPKKKFHSSVVSSVKDLRFGFVDGDGGNRVFDGLVDDSVQGVGEFDGDESATFRDADGSVTRCPSDTNWEGPVQIVKPEVTALTKRCAYRENWNMAVCSDRYGKIKAQPKGFFRQQDPDEFDNGGQMRRRRYDDNDEIYVEDYEKKPITEYIVILGSDEYYYEFQYMEDFPKTARFTGMGVDKNQSVVVGACLPEGVTKDDFEYYARTPDDISIGTKEVKFVDSFDDVVSDRWMTKLYLNGRMLYFRLSSKKVRNANWDRHDTDHCAGDYCPRVNIIMKKQMPYSPCFTPTVEQLSGSKVMASIKSHDCELPASDPEPDWGAGDTLAPENGNWGQWSGWSDCCNDGASVVQRTRYRLCDDPSPLGSGADCVGESLETEPCPFACPENGEFTDWSDYSECFCDGIAEGSGGARVRYRECVGTSNGGTFCNGEFIKYGACRNKCGSRTDQSVDGVMTPWSEWTDCFCDGMAKGSKGIMVRTRSCEGMANLGDYCQGSTEDVRPCDGDCYPEQ